MPYGKIVVIKRGGGDGTEFPLTATCLFGRKPDCDIRIQLPHVSKEHCRVELNENKEVILTNMSSVNPTRVNGEELQQTERLKHGDVITIIDRSFRFEYPQQQTPKKSLVSGKADTLQVLHEQLRTPRENRTSEISTGPRLKDGANNDNIQRSLDKTMEVDSNEDGSLQHRKADSPFNELYQMIKHSLETPRKPAGQPQPQTPATKTPATKTPTPKPTPGLITKVVSQAEVASTPSKDEIKSRVVATAKSPKRGRKSLDATATPVVAEAMGSRPQTPKPSAPARETPKKKRLSLPSQTPTTAEVPATPTTETPLEVHASEEVEHQVATQKPKTPTRRKSKEATPVKPAAEEHQEPAEAACATPTAGPVKASPRVSPRSVEKKLKAQIVQQELEAKAAASEKKASKQREAEVAASQRTMRKRVSFGGHLSPELFDKRLPPSSPLQKGATPRRSFSLAAPKQSLLRRASVIGLIKELDDAKSPKAKSPVKKSPKAKTPSPAKKSPSVAKTPEGKRRSASPASDQTAAVSGRFSVSRISTPSPLATPEAATPKVPLRRKSMKSASRKTPRSLLKNAVEVLRRRSGVSRASLKGSSWVNIVKFGQPKSQTAAPPKKPAAVQKARKAVVAVVAEPKTPVRKSLKGHVSTGHADSPVTIVVGKAFNQKAVHHAGAAPKLVHSVALLKRNVKMDEDLTGISEIFSTPGNARKRKSDAPVKPVAETPSRALSTSVVEMSVMNTPEETGEMVVSPLGVISATKRRAFNSEAVQRLLQSKEGSSFSGEALESPDKDSQKEVLTKEATPKQKPVQRTARTPKQKAEPIDDLRGKLLKTPKQKPQQVDCLSAVKRIMKTPKQKSKPVEDLRGKLLKTPRLQKVSGEMELEGIKQLLATPKQREEPVSVVTEVVVQETLATPVETITPVEETITPVEEVVEKTLVTPEEAIAPVEDEVEETLAAPEETIAPVEELIEETIAPAEELVEETLAAPEETIAPVEGLVEKTIAPVEETIAPAKEVVVEETFAAPEETLAPVEELVVEDVDETGADKPTENKEDQHEESSVMESDMATASQVSCEEPQEDEPCAQSGEGAADIVEVSQADPTTDSVSAGSPAKDLEDVVAMETAPEEVAEQSPPEPQAEDEREVIPADQDTALNAPAPLSKPVREKRAKATKPVTHKEPAPEEPATPVRGRRRPAQKTPAAPQAEEPMPARSRRGRPAENKTVEEAVVTSLAEAAQQETPLKPRRGRNAKTAPAVEAVPETSTTSTTTTEETSNQAPPTDAALADTTAIPAVPAVKTQTRRGRNAKQVPEEEEEEAAPAVKVEKPRRGRKVPQQEPRVETVQEENREVVADESPSTGPQPEEPAPVTGKSRRGRKAVQEAAPEPAAEPAPEPEVVVVEQVRTEEQAPVRAKRGRQTKAKPEDEKAEEEVHIPVVQEAVEKQATEKSRRTRKTKQESVEETAASEELKVVEESSVKEEVRAPAAPSKTRGRRGKPEEVEQPPVESVSAPEAVEQTSVAPAEKPKRGRRQTRAEEPELVVPPTEAKEKPKRGGRRAKAEAVVVEEKAAELPEEKVEPELAEVQEEEETTESTSASAVEPPARVVKSTRGKRAAVTAPPTAPVKRRQVSFLDEAAAVEPAAAVTRPAARGRAGKRGAVETVDVPAEAPVEPADKGEEEEEEEEEEEKKVQPKRGRTSKKTTSTPKDRDSLATTEDGKTKPKSVKATPAPTPVLKATRGRKAAVAAAPATPVPVVPVATAAKRKATRGQSKAEEEDLSEVSQPVKRTRKATKVL